METIEMLINELDSEILKAKKAPFSSSEIIMNKAVMLDLAERLRTNYPAVIKESVQIKKERDEILAKAEKYANDCMDNAEAQANAMVSETEIVKAAKTSADAMRKEAEENYKRLDYEARAFAFNILVDAEATLGDGLSLINERKTDLADRAKNK